MVTRGIWCRTAQFDDSGASSAAGSVPLMPCASGYDSAKGTARATPRQTLLAPTAAGPDPRSEARGARQLPAADHTAGEEAEATAELAETAIGRTEPARPIRRADGGPTSKGSRPLDISEPLSCASKAGADAVPSLYGSRMADTE
jgi:hypothetical protein